MRKTRPEHLYEQILITVSESNTLLLPRVQHRTMKKTDDERF